jgi:hypothetical protein
MKNIRRTCILRKGTAWLAVVLMVSIMSAEKCHAGRPAHMEYPIKLMNLETGYVLGNGQSTRIGLGDSGFGVMNTVQFTTNTLMDAITLVNGQVKVRVLPESLGLFSLSTGLAYYNLVSSQYIIDTIVEEAFTEESINLESGLDILCWFLSASRKIGPAVRLHAGYQYRRLQGNLTTKDPVVMDDDDGESIGVELDFEETAEQNCIMFGADADLFSHLKIMLELGYDFSYERSRGGAGLRLGLGGAFAIQAGVLWPGIKLDEDIDYPVLPHFSLFWRF